MMRCFAVLLFLFLVSGCAQTEQFNVSFSGASHSDVWDAENNRTLDSFSFVLTNNEEFVLYCDLVVSLDNGSDSSASRGSVGLLGSGVSKNVSVPVDMFFGDTDIKMVPVCSRP